MVIDGCLSLLLPPYNLLCDMRVYITQHSQNIKADKGCSLNSPTDFFKHRMGFQPVCSALRGYESLSIKLFDSVRGANSQIYKGNYDLTLSLPKKKPSTIKGQKCQLSSVWHSEHSKFGKHGTFFI